MCIRDSVNDVGHVSFQLQLYTNGVIVFSYQNFTSGDFVGGSNPDIPNSEK